MSESKIVKQVQLAATRIGSRLFRNNTGLGWVGRSKHYSKTETVRVGAGDVVIRSARPLHAGLCVGSSDLIGWTPVIIDNEMVGRQVAIFTAAECKTATGRATPEQLAFIDTVNRFGGYAAICRSADDLIKILDGEG